MRPEKVVCLLLMILAAGLFAADVKQQVAEPVPTLTASEPQTGIGNETVTVPARIGSPLTGGTCETATVIPSLPFSESSTFDATDDCAGRPYRDVFYRYTAVLSGSHTFDLCGSAGDAYLRIWTDGTCCSGASVTADDNCGGANPNDPTRSVNLAVGQTVFIECGTYSSTDPHAEYVFHAHGPVPPPPNDNCTDAVTLTVNADEPTCGTTVGATVDCERSSFPEVWYAFTLTECMDVAVEYCGTTVSGHLLSVLYSGSCCGTHIPYSTYEYTTCPDGLITLHFDRLPAGQYWLPVGFDHPGEFCVRIAGVPCCVIRDYCADPIVLGPVLHYEEVVNTCCATNVVECVWRDTCGVTPCYQSGNDVVFQFTVTNQAVVTITVGGPLDNQVMLFTDCAAPGASCIASKDATLSGQQELIGPISIPPGTYYVSVSGYPTSACGPIRFVIDSDQPLPVAFVGATANPGDCSVTLGWITASETQNDRFEVVRGDRVVQTIRGAGTSPIQHRYTWTETGLMNGTTYTYALRAVSLSGGRQELATVHATPRLESATITEYALLQNSPNPFNSRTNITFDLPEPGLVKLNVYNMVGQGVARVASQRMDRGRHTVNYDAVALPSGVYVYRIEVNGFTATRKMLLLK